MRRTVLNDQYLELIGIWLFWNQGPALKISKLFLVTMNLGFHLVNLLRASANDNIKNES
jgi:hypothetical protein